MAGALYFEWYFFSYSKSGDVTFLFVPVPENSSFCQMSNQRVYLVDRERTRVCTRLALKAFELSFRTFHLNERLHSKNNLRAPTPFPPPLTSPGLAFVTWYSRSYNPSLLFFFTSSSTRAMRCFPPSVWPYFSLWFSLLSDVEFEKDAIKKYTECLDQLPDKRSQLAVKCYSNRSACYKQLSNFDATVEDTTAVLEVEPSNVKALIRRAQAFEAIERWL